jgi:hypothetical protein
LQTSESSASRRLQILLVLGRWLGSALPSDLVQGVAVPQFDVVCSLGRQHVIGAHDGVPGGVMARGWVWGTIVPALMCGAAALTAARLAASRMPRR